MTTATLESPPPSDQLDLITHSFNADGDCLDPERIHVKMPKGCICELRLANDAGGVWRIGYQLAAGKEGAVDVYPSLNVLGYRTRALALEAALRVAVEFFEASPKSKLHKKCAGEVHAYIITVGGGSPANKPSARVPLPEPKPMDLELARLEANPHNPRGIVDQDAADIEELAETIKTVGLLQPIGVRILSDDQGLPGIGENRLQLLWGHRRMAAFRRLKRDTIPARVYEGITDEQARLLLLIENGQQKQLDPIQEARGYAEMVRDFELTQDDVAKVVKKSRPVVANALRLLELPAEVQSILQAGGLSLAHGTALCRFKQWPAVCSTIAELAAKTGASANSLEKNLPFHEELADAGLAVDLCGYDTAYALDFEKVKKLAKSEPSIFAWTDKERYDDFGFTLSPQLGKELLTEEQKSYEAAEAKRDERQQSGERTSGGELTPAAKRARQKKLDENLTNRLQTSTMMHAAVARMKDVDDIDLPALYIITYEAFRHLGGYGCEIDEQIAKELGIKLPKNFDSSDLKSVSELKPVDALRMAAAGLARRDAESAMRFASEVPDFVDMLIRQDTKEKLDAPSYVAEWREKIFPLVTWGKRAEQVQTELGCPEFVAVQLVREIKRELRAAGIEPLKETEAKILATLQPATIAQFRTDIKHEQSNARIANTYMNPKQILPEISAVRRLVELEAALAKSSAPKEEPAEKPKPAAKAAKKKAVKKGGKKK